MKTKSSEAWITPLVVLIKTAAVIFVAVAFFMMDMHWGPSADEYVGARAFVRLMLFFAFSMCTVGIIVVNLKKYFKKPALEDFDVVTALFVGMTKEDLAHYGFTKDRLIDSYKNAENDDELMSFRPFREFKGRTIITFYLVRGQVIMWDAETIPMMHILLRERDYMRKWF